MRSLQGNECIVSDGELNTFWQLKLWWSSSMGLSTAMKVAWIGTDIDFAVSHVTWSPIPSSELKVNLEGETAFHFIGQVWFPYDG